MAFFGPTPANPAVSVLGVEGPNSANLVTSHFPGSALPAQLEPPSDDMHRAGLAKVVLLMLNLGSCASTSEENGLLLEALRTSGSSFGLVYDF